MTLPDLEPRSSTLDTLDAAAWHLQHARRAVLDEVAYLARELDRLRAESARWEARARAAETELVRVIKEASDGRRG